MSTIEETTQDKTSIFEETIEGYIKQINSLIGTMPIVLNILASNTIMHIDKVNEFVKKHKIDKMEVGESSTFPLELYGCCERLSSNADKAIEAMQLYPCNIVVSLVSIYDAFLGNIIKAIYRTTPERLKECSRQFSVTEILQFESIEEAKERVIEKEAESVVRESHIEQLEWLKKKIGTSFKDFASYKKFVEITERRNLFVHTNGIVSRQYISVCNSVEVENINDIKAGDKLGATPEYVIECYKVLYEVGVKLGIVVWRKLMKGNKKADYYLNTICYDLIKQEKYDMAKTMLHFATETIKDAANDEVRRMFIINYALAHYLSGDKKACIKILGREDWTASATMFKLAEAVLKEDYKLAASKMEAAKSDINNVAYCEWPLFKDFRNSEEFKTEYERLFGQGFEYNEPEKENYKDVLQYALDIQNKVKKLAKEETNEDECSGCTATEEVLES